MKKSPPASAPEFVVPFAHRPQSITPSMRTSKRTRQVAADSKFARLSPGLPKKFWRTDTSGLYQEDYEIQALNLFGVEMQAAPVQSMYNRCIGTLDFVWGDETKLHKSFLSEFVKIPEDFDTVVRLSEDVITLIYGLIRSRCRSDRYMAIFTYVKLRGSRFDIVTLLMVAFSETFGLLLDSSNKLDVQSDEFFADARTYLDSYDNLKNTKIFKKLHKFGMYALSLSLFTKLGITFDNFSYTQIEAEAVKRKFHKGPDMVHCILDTALFLCERGYQCMKTRTMSPIFHSGSAYEKWFERANKLKLDARLLTNPVPHGINRFKFLADLKDVIEKGESIRKFSVSLDTYEKKTVAVLLDALKTIHGDELTKRAAMQERKAPFSVLIYGGSSVAKSLLTNVMFVHYGKLYGLPTESEFMYTRNPAEEFWSLFNSTQWCLRMDDIAFLAPSLGVLDPTMSELLQVSNNTPFVPQQADLPDKGRTPFNGELVLATSNTEHLNVHAYFSCPLAVSRRLPFVIVTTPKEEYMKHGCMIDGEKLPMVPDGEYPDFWNFTVKKVLPATDVIGAGAQARLDVVAHFTDINAFLEWFRVECDAHRANQAKALVANSSIQGVKLCEMCHRVTSKCTCDVADLVDHMWDAPPRAFSSDDEQADALGPTRWCTFCKLNHSVSISEDVCVERFVEETMRMMASSSTASDAGSSGSYWSSEASDDRPFWDYRREVSSLWRYCTMKNVKRSVLCVDCINKRDHECNYAKRRIWYTDPTPPYDCCEEDDSILRLESPLYQLRMWCFLRLLTFCADHWYFSLFMCWWYGDFWKYRLGMRYFSQFQTLRVVFRCAGHRVQNQIGIPRILLGIYAVTASAAVLSMIYKGFSAATTNVFPTEVQTSVGVTPADKGEKTAFYQHDPYRVTPTDLSATSRAYQASTNLPDKILRNSVTFISSLTPPQPGVERHYKVNAATNVFDHVYMVNEHGIPPTTPFFLTVISGPTTQCVGSSSRDILVTEGMVVRWPERDLAFIELRHRPPGYDLSPYFPSHSFEGKLVGEYIGIDRMGEKFHRSVQNIVSGVYAKGDYQIPIWFGKTPIPTVQGCCGSLLSSQTLGMVLLGIHYLGTGNTIGAIKVFDHDMTVVRAHFNRIPCERGALPISAPSAQRELAGVHPKSPVLWTQSGTANVFGSFKGFRPRGSSSVTPTLICDSMVKRGVEVQFGPPVMDWKPWWNAFQDLSRPVTRMNTDLLEVVTKDFIHDIMSGLSDDDFALVQVFDDRTAVNGAAGVRYCDKMNRRTSAGAPYKKSKSFFLEIENDALGEYVEVSSEIMARVDTILATYWRGERFHAQFCGNLKDEPIKFKKIAAGKVRVFCGSEFAWSIVVRKYLLSFIMLVQNNRFLFEAGPGTIAQSLEWEEIREYLTQHGTSRMVAGDYAAFDKRMPATVILATFDVILAVCKRAGYTEQDLHVVAGIGLDTAFPNIDFNGDMIEFFGSNPSGHPLTVIVNGLANSLYMRYCYAVASGTGHARDFKKNVALMTYGDDNIMGVSSNCDFFNHTRIQAVLQDVDIQYTMADKEAVSEPFITISDCTFLKRSWRFDCDVGAYLAPLERTSIDKMLTVCVRSKTVSPEAHAVAVISTAIREYFFWGKEEFEHMTTVLREVVAENKLEYYVEESTFPTWDDLHEAFIANSTHVKLQWH
jgi:hypothetical protein